MLNEIRISNFKCFEQLELPLRPMTLLTGTNGGGKSTVVQSLVLMSRTIALREWSKSLLLDWPDLALGNAADVLNQRAGGRRVHFGFTTDGDAIDWAFTADDRRAFSLPLVSSLRNGHAQPLAEAMRWLLPVVESEPPPKVIQALQRVQWITAERSGPRDLMPLQETDMHSHVGSRGENAAGLLYWREDADAHPSLRREGYPQTLFHQVRAWMAEFFPGCDLRVAPVDGASAIALRMRSNPRQDFQRPQNVGFGFTQLFPIIVGVLAAKPGDCLVIENPEVHLHPRGQQRIGEFLTLAATTGIQIIVETHSDHVLNGLRVITKSGFIQPDALAVHYFAPAADDEPSRPVSPKLDAAGRLSDWPEGFFDQFDIALSELL